MYKVDNNDYEVYEEPIGLVKVPKTDAEILYTNRQQIFQALDEVTNELLRWFDQQDIKIVAEVEKMFLSASC